MTLKLLTIVYTFLFSQCSSQYVNMLLLLEIPVETSTSPINAKERNGPENLPIVPIILGILAVFVMAVNAFIIVFKWRRSARQLPANNIEYSSALQQVHMVNSRN